MRVGSSRHRTGGFTFLWLMAIIAIMGVALLAVGEVWHTARQREKEQRLLFVGDQFRRAFQSYYSLTPPGRKGQLYPFNLEDLLKDPRYPSTVRHIRKLYSDPITGTDNWGLLKNANGSIYGIYSMSEDIPLKQTKFKKIDADFDYRSKYSEWIFKHVPIQNPDTQTKK